MEHILLAFQQYFVGHEQDARASEGSFPLKFPMGVLTPSTIYAFFILNFIKPKCTKNI
jgi:hypothetical protein